MGSVFNEFNIKAGKQLKNLTKDFGLAFRALRKRPGFTLLVVLTLSLGIGATSSIFSVVNAVLLQELPYPNADRLVFFRLYAGQFNGGVWASLGEYHEFNDQSEMLEEVAAVLGGGQGYVVVDNQSQPVVFGVASANLFPMLGVAPLLGRVFTDEDSRIPFGAGAPKPPVVISHSVWQNVYGGDSDILGRRIEFEGGDGNGPEIAGVLPASFNLELENGVAEEIGIWQVLPNRSGANPYGRRFLRGLIGKLKPGVALAAAQAENDVIMQRIVAEHPEANSDGPNPRFVLVPLFDDIVGPVRPTILILFSAVSLVFLVACGNAASVLLARTTTRQKELAVHAAMGAGRAAIARIILTESLALAFLAGIIGALLASVGIDLLMLLEPGRLPRVEGIAVNAPVFAFTIGLSLFATLLFGLFPALKASSPKAMSSNLKQGGRLGGGIGSGARRVLVSGQVAFSIVLLIGTGLLVRSFLNMRQTDLGFEPAQTLTFRARLDGQRFAPITRWDVFRQYTAAIGELPEVSAAGGVDLLPLIPTAAQIWDARAEGAVNSVNAYVRRTLPGYFEAMHINLVAGRILQDVDLESNQAVAVVNQAFVRAFWPDESPIAKWLTWNQGDPQERRVQVIGVVEDARITSVDSPALPQIYVPYTETPFGVMQMVVRYSGEPGSLLPQLERLAGEIGLGRSIDQVRPLQGFVDDSTAAAEFAAIIMSVLGITALILSAVGIYGTIAYIVSLKTKEMGIRIALGAQSTNVVSINVREGLQLTGVGIAVGVVGAVIATRFLETLLYGVTATDPLTFVGVSLLVVTLGGIASLVPSLRAARVSPMLALREE